MYKINIKSDDRLGKTPNEAAMLILKELRENKEAEDAICFIVPAVWSWSHDSKFMRFCMSELIRNLVEAVGDKFKFTASCNEYKELSVIAKCVTARN